MVDASLECENGIDGRHHKCHGDGYFVEVLQDDAGGKIKEKKYEKWREGEKGVNSSTAPLPVIVMGRG